MSAGKPVEQVRRDYGLERIEKLASNENQFGPSPKAIEAIKNEVEHINFYPEASAYDLVDDLAEHFDVKPGNIVVGNGGEGLIWDIAMTFINEGDEIIVTASDFRHIQYFSWPDGRQGSQDTVQGTEIRL